jgi:probable HAF family extracellular repeat protein
MKRHNWYVEVFFWVIILGLAGLGGVANAQTYGYKIDRLDPIAHTGTTPWQSWATALNEFGDAVGISTQQSSYINHATNWTNIPPFSVDDLGTLGGAGSEAYGIAPWQRVGRSQTSTGAWHACRFSPVFNPIDLTVDHSGIAYAVNINRLAVGWDASLNGFPCLWDDGGVSHRLGKAGYSGRAYAIAPGSSLAAGYVNGSGTNNHDHAALLYPGDHQELGALPTGWESYAYGVNNAGQAVGKSNFLQDPNYMGTHAVKWDAGGGITDLGVLQSLPGQPDLSVAFAINSRGYVVGFSGRERAVLWRPGHQIEDLTSMLSPADQYHWTLEVAYGINDKGQIVGQGTYDASTRGFRLTPIASPYKITSIEDLIMMLLLEEEPD